MARREQAGYTELTRSVDSMLSVLKLQCGKTHICYQIKLPKMKVKPLLRSSTPSKTKTLGENYFLQYRTLFIKGFKLKKFSFRLSLNDVGLLIKFKPFVSIQPVSSFPQSFGQIQPF